MRQNVHLTVQNNVCYYVRNMIQIINTTQIRQELPSLLNYVNQTGGKIVVTRGGKPVAKIVPYSPQISVANYKQQLLNLDGGWFNLREYKKQRKRTKARLKKLYETSFT